MKQLTILSALLLLITTMFGQVKQLEEKSKLESFTDKSGSLIQKTFIEIGKIKGLEIQVLTLEDVTENTKLSGLRLSSEYYSSLGSESKIAFLDKDEVDGLIKSLKYYEETVFQTTPENYTEYNFKSRSGFSASVFQDKKKEWNIVLQLERFDGRSKVYVKKDDFKMLIDLIGKAKEKLI